MKSHVIALYRFYACLASQKPDVMQALNVRWSQLSFRFEINAAQRVLPNFGVVYSSAMFCCCCKTFGVPAPCYQRLLRRRGNLAGINVEKPIHTCGTGPPKTIR